MAGPDGDDGDEADCYEDEVEDEEQAVNDETHLEPLLFTLVPCQLLVHLQADGLEVFTQPPQLLQGLILHLWPPLLWSWSISHVRHCH